MRLTFADTLLLMIDVQNDFCPEYGLGGIRRPAGSLAVADGCSVVAPLNSLSAAFSRAGARVAATQDWHPAGHLSFASSHPGRKPGELADFGGLEGNVLWPDHCVRGSSGADFHAGLDTAAVNLIVRKGFRPALDSYSAFWENDRKTPTGLDGWIRSLGIASVVIGGLATDYCVFYSAMDARKLGLVTVVATDAVRGVGYPAGSVEAAVSRMREAGVVFMEAAEIAGELA